MALVEDRPGAVRADGEKVTTSLPVWVRRNRVRGSLGRLLYRAEPARDWEPRLDDIWDRAKGAYPVAAARDADHALKHFSGHPTVRHHRFLGLPRLSSRAVAFAVFADDGADCCWLDLVWDHAHPGALELLAHISARLVSQWQRTGERLYLAGDDAASALLAHRGFRIQEERSHAVDPSTFNRQLDAEDAVSRAYLTAADIGEIDP